MKNVQSTIALVLSAISIGVSMMNRVTVSDVAVRTDIDKLNERITEVNRARGEIDVVLSGNISDVASDVEALKKTVEGNDR